MQTLLHWLACAGWVHCPSQELQQKLAATLMHSMQWADVEPVPDASDAEVDMQGTCLRISLEDGCLLAESAQQGVSMRRQDLDANLISPGFAKLLHLDRPVAVLVRLL